jgi:transposase
MYNWGMSRPATAIILMSDERETLSKWVRAKTSEQRIVLRSKIILLAAEGLTTKEISQRLEVRPATVSQWRNRFAAKRLEGLQDAPRSGKPRRYKDDTEIRILGQLDEKPPPGHATWSGNLMARVLGDISEHQVWRVLRKHGIHLRRRHSWCISTDPQFAEKAADIVGLYLSPPDNAVVICVDEKPAIQALERAQGYLRLPNGKAITGYNHEYKRHGTTTLFAALNVATGQVKGGHYGRRRRREFLDFINAVVVDYPDKEIHVILDNSKTHKPKNDRWLARHKNVYFHYTPTHASWLNQIEIWFSILSRRALRGASFVSVKQLRQAIDEFIKSHNQTAAPFEWKKIRVHAVPLKQSYADLCK